MESSPGMWIEELTIKGYGKLQNVTFRPSRGINVITGPHDAGKSSVANCVRDLLLGAGRWVADENGPRAPDARPRNGERFYARIQYRISSHEGYLLQRDLERNVCRIQDAQGVTVEGGSGAAPGVVEPEFTLPAAPETGAEGMSPAATEALRVAQERLNELEEERVRWQYHVDRARREQVRGRLRRIKELEAQEAELTARMQSLPTPLPPEELERLEKAEQALLGAWKERDALRERLEELNENRRSISMRLQPFEKFYIVSPEEVEAVRAMGDGAASPEEHLEEQRKHMEGFRAQEADIQRRLDDMGPRLASLGSEDEFEIRLASLEKELARNELLVSRTADRDRNLQKAAGLSISSKGFLAGAIVSVGVGAGLVAWLVGQPGAVGAGLVGLAGLLAVGCGVLRQRVEAQRAEVLSTNEPIAAEVERLGQAVQSAREELRGLLEQTCVTTLRDLRGRYREHRNLQRDLSTVRDYIADLEKKIAQEEAGVAARGKAPRALVDCGLLAPGEPVSARMLAEFLERYGAFRSLVEQEESLKTQIRETMREVEQRRQEAEGVEAERDALVEGQGPAGEGVHRARAIQDRSTERERLRGEMESLRQRREQEAGTEGVPALEASLGELEERLRALEAQMPALSAARVDASMLEFYRRNLDEAESLRRKFRGEVSSLRGKLQAAAPRPVAVAPAEPEPELEDVARRVEEHYQAITGHPVRVRLEAVAVAKGRVALPPAGLVLKVQEPSGDSWGPPTMLGRTASELLHGLLQGEARASPEGGNMPIFLDSPFSRLDDERRTKGFEWLLDLSQRRQVFFLTAETSDREGIVGLAAERGLPLAGERCGELEFWSEAREGEVA